MTQDELKKFWTKVYPGLRLSEGKLHWMNTIYRLSDQYTRCWITPDEKIVFCGEELPDPSSPEVPLEVLWDGWWEAAQREMPSHEAHKVLDSFFALPSPGFRAALIAAINEMPEAHHDS